MIDTKAKRELALKATPGKWMPFDNKHWVYPVTQVRDGNGTRIAWFKEGQPFFWGTTGKAEIELANATFIASNDPQSIIAMCDEIDRLRGLVGRMAEGLKPFGDCARREGRDIMLITTYLEFSDYHNAAALVEEAKKEIEG